jgi:hypothetical protein
MLYEIVWALRVAMTGDIIGRHNPTTKSDDKIRRQNSATKFGDKLGDKLGGRSHLSPTQFFATLVVSCSDILLCDVLRRHKTGDANHRGNWLGSKSLDRTREVVRRAGHSRSRSSTDDAPAERQPARSPPPAEIRFLFWKLPGPVELNLAGRGMPAGNYFWPGTAYGG